MKLKTPNVADKASPSVDGKVTLTHHQTIRQSFSYQTAEVSYGATITVKDTPADRKRGQAYLEKLVEDRLGEKVPEQAEVLVALAKSHK